MKFETEEEREDFKDFIERCKFYLEDQLKEQEELWSERQRKYNKAKKGARDKYENSEKGMYARSKVNFNRRTRFEKASDDLTWFEKKEIGRFYKNCPEGYEVDHIYPIAKGGKHIISNLQYLTQEENRKKKDKVTD